MDPLRHFEERRRRIDHDPARVDSRASRIAEQRLQQLRHSPAPRRRVDVPDDPTREELSRPLDRRLDLRVVVAYHGTETLIPERRHGHVDESIGAHVAIGTAIAR